MTTSRTTARNQPPRPHFAVSGGQDNPSPPGPPPPNVNAPAHSPLAASPLAAGPSAAAPITGVLPAGSFTSNASGTAATADDHATTREHFIPLGINDLLEALTRELTTEDEDRRVLARLCRLLERTFHLHHHRRYCDLLEEYAPFDPDRDTLPLHELTAEQRQRQVANVAGMLGQVFREANYRRLNQEEIEQAIRSAGDWSIRLVVDFDKFERLEVYARGDAVVQKRKRDWQTRMRERTFEVPVYQRLAVVFQLKTPSSRDNEEVPRPLHIKLFKNIPKSDLEMLLPETRVCMSWFDRGRILVPTVSGLGLTVYKLIRGTVAIVFVGIYGLLGFLGLLAGVIGYGIKSLLGYLRTRDKYQLRLTRNLYFQNLDNNSGALHRLIADAEEQEFREVLLGYFLLWREGGPEGWTATQLDQAAEAYLSETIGRHVDYEIHDALYKLERLGLVEREPGARWRAIPLHEAWKRLRKQWDELPEVE